MSNYLSSPHFKAWQRKNKVRSLALIIAANCLHILLLVLGYRRLMAAIFYFFPNKTAKYFLSNPSEVQQLKKLVNPIFKKIRNSKYWWSNCFSSSILLWFILRNQGLQTQVIIGTKKEGDTFKAHAWVECNHFPLNENKSVRTQYAVFEHDFSGKYYFLT
jgi:hypothetical protein